MLVPLFNLSTLVVNHLLHQFAVDQFKYQVDRLMTHKLAAVCVGV